MSVKANQKFKKWKTITRIGQGGNGFVWKAVNDSGQTGAIKFLHDRYLNNIKKINRFKDEIKIQSECSEIDGVLPVLDSNFPNNINNQNRPWLVTPYADQLIDSIGSEFNLELIIEAFSYLGQTLEILHRKNISHRDIKPENIFHLEGKWLLGDFGLASFPDKQNLTTKAERLGPILYIAPEMLNNAENADGKKADVYSYAKCLWVAITGLRFPIPGQLLRTVQQLRLSEYVTHSRLLLLESLIESCTSFHPEERPLMSSIVSSLNEWRSYKEPAGNQLEISDRFKPLVEKETLSKMEKGKNEKEFKQLNSDLNQYLESQVQKVRSITALNTHTLGNTNRMLLLYKYIKNENPFRQNCSLSVRYDLPLINQSIDYELGFLIECDYNGHVYLQAGDGIIKGRTAYKTMNIDMVEFQLGSPDIGEKITLLFEKLKLQIDASLIEYAEAIEKIQND